MQALRVGLLVAWLGAAAVAESEPGCVIELECRECVPDHMPLVRGPRARGGRVRAAHGEELRLACGGGALRAFPGHGELRVRCEAGRYRVPLDNSLRHLLELGCQADVFEDVLHEVEGCGAPLQGRAWRVAGGERHLATLCFDADRAVARRIHAVSPPDELRLPPHSDNFSPLTILGNFNHMFDATSRAEAAALFSDEASANRRLRELLKHEHVTLAEQTVTHAELLAPHYFHDQDARVTDFVSNKVVAWRSVAHGNWRHLQLDVAAALQGAARGNESLQGAARGNASLQGAARGNASLHVWAGAAGALALRGRGGRAPVSLRAGGRFPAPRYLWTALLQPARKAGLALVVLNDPFVAVSEIKEAVFCASACSRVSWLRALRRNRNYEVPVLGLAFCCSLRDFAAARPDLPRDIVPDLDRYTLLTDLDGLDLRETDTTGDSV